MAPFWADINIATSVGEIYYQVYTSGSEFDGLDNVSSFISAEMEVSFSGSWMLVAEWHEVIEFGQSTATTAVSQLDCNLMVCTVSCAKEGVYSMYETTF